MGSIIIVNSLFAVAYVSVQASIPFPYPSYFSELVDQIYSHPFLHTTTLQQTALENHLDETMKL